jgi:hypothetical protein
MKRLAKRRGSFHGLNVSPEALEARRLLAALTFAKQPQTVASGVVMGEVDVALPPGGSGVVTLSLGQNPGSMSLGGTTTALAVNGKASFKNLYLYGGTPAKSFTLLAYAAGFDATPSSAFDVKIGPAALNIANLVPSQTAGQNLGASMAVTVQVLDVNGTVSRDDSTTAVTLYLAKDPGGASFVDGNGNSLGTTLTKTVSDGMAAFPGIGLGKAGSGYVLGAIAANSSVILPASSSPFAITPAKATKLAFDAIPTAAVKQPINMNGRNPPFEQAGVKVRAVDPFGNPAADFTGMVTVALGSHPTPGSTKLDGELTAPAVQGVARFNSLNLDTAGNGYTLTATAPGLTGTATSNAFNVAPLLPTHINLLAPSILTVGINEKLPVFVAQILDAQNHVVATDSTTRITLGPAGVLFGAVTVTAKNGIATFDNVFMGLRGLKGPADRILNVQAMASELAGIQSNVVAMTVTPGVPRSLGFANTTIDPAVAGDPLKSNGGSIEVDVLDISNNVVDVSGVVVSVGVNQAAPNSNATLLGQGDDPTNPASLALYQTATTTNGRAIFKNLFINRASTDYQLAVGTTSFFNYSATVSSEFNVSIGAADQVRFLAQPVALVGSRRAIPGDGVTLAAAVTDRVGNVIVGDSTTRVTMGLSVPADAPAGTTLQTGDPAGLTKTVVKGVAIFDAIYVDQAAPPPPPHPQNIPGYKLLASSPTLTKSATSREFTVSPPPSVPIPTSLDLQTPPPKNLAVNAPFTLTYQLTPPGAGVSYKDEPIAAFLVDATTGVPTVGFGLIGTSAGVIPDDSNRITFSSLQIDHAGTFRIRAISNIGGRVSISDSFTVGGGGSFAAAVASAAAPVDTSPHAVSVGLGSYIQNFNYYQSLPIYKAKLIPPNAPPSDPNDPTRLVQPNVTPGAFDQVPTTSRWWSSLIFQRTKAVGIDQSDSQGNRLFPMFADPLAAMVNSNDGGANDFAGIGLARLTHLFVNPAGQFLDPAQTKPNSLFGGNDKFFYSYYGILQPDQRLYQDLSIGLQGVKADATVMAYSDWTATFNWSDAAGNPKLQALMGEGLPYAYFTASDPKNPTPMQIVTGNSRWKSFTLTASVYDPGTGTLKPVAPGSGPATGPFQLRIQYQVDEVTAPNDPTPITISVDNTYGIYLPKGVSWTLSGNTIQFTLAPGANYVSVATLPDNSTATFNYYRQRAYSFVTGSAVNFSYDDATGNLTTTYSLQTTQVESGADLLANHPLQALYLNQYRNLLPNTPLTSFTYATARGTTKVFDGPAFVTQLQSHGVLPQVVPVAGAPGFETTLWRQYLYPFLLSVSSGGPNDGTLNLKTLLPTNNNNYQEGQAMLGAAQLIPILNEVADSDPTTNPDLSPAERDLARSTARLVFQLVEDRMSAWLSATDDQAPYVLYYQPQSPFEDPTGQQLNKVGWQAIMPVQGGFLSPEGINDQNLIEGYFVKVAAILAQYDPTWGDRSVNINDGTSVRPAKYGDLINILIKNVANTDRNDPMSPFLRNFDIFQGHSWADGSANNQVGTNQESSSESLNFASGLILWGEATGDKSMRDVGIYLYETEVDSVDTYWFDVNGTDAFPQAFTGGDHSNDPKADRPLLPFPHTGDGEIGGFVGDIRSNFAGIQTIPLTGGSYYLGRDPAFVQRLYNWAAFNTSQVGQVPIQTPSYLTMLYPYLALADPAQALSLYQAAVAAGTIGPINPNLPIDTNAFNIHWITGLLNYGQVDTTVTADTATYTVFRKSASDPTSRTFVAYNSEPVAKTVHFFDATGKTILTLTVAPRTIVAADATGKAKVSQTTPDYALATPPNRFFFSSAGGKPSLLQGKAGAGGESALNIPADGSPLTFTLTNVYGTLKSSSALEDYALYVDPTFHSDGSTPTIQVSISYQNAGDANPTVILFTKNVLNPLPGFVRADSSTAITGPTPFHLPTLTNATVIISIRQVDLGKNPLPVRLRTDAAAEQGRTSYITLPYNISSIGSAVTPAAATKAAAPTAAPQVSALVAPPRGSGHTYTASLVGTTATFEGNASSDTLIFSAAGGLLKHNRFSAGDPGFASDFDFDSTTPGVQTLPATVGSRVVVFTGSGEDTVVIGTKSAPASSLGAAFSVANGDGVPDVLTIDDSANATALDYVVDPGRISVGSGTLSVDHTGAFSSIALTTGRASNRVSVLGVRPGDNLALDTKGGTDVVAIGDGNTAQILGSVQVRNTSAFSHLIVDDSQGRDFSDNVTISSTGITGISPGPILFNRSDLDDLEVYGGTNSGTYYVTSSIDGSYTYLDPGQGDDRVVVGHSGTIDDANFPGLVIVQGDGQTRLAADNSAGPAKSIETSLVGLEGLITPGFEFSDVSTLGVVLGSGDDAVTVFNTIPATSYAFFTGGGNDTVSVNVLNSPLFVDAGAGNDRILTAQDPALVTKPMTLLGGPGDDTIQGGPFDDLLAGGPGDDTIFGGAGNDIISWQSGDGRDSIDGGAGRDAVVVSGARGLADSIAVAPDGTQGVVAIAGATSGGLRIGSVETLNLLTGGGPDKIGISPLLDTAVNVVGADPGAPREATLSVVTTPSDGHAFGYLGAGSGTWTFRDRSPVTFLNVGTFNAPSEVQYVLALYRTVLDRVPDGAEANVWIAALDHGASRLDVSRGFWESPEHRGLQVDDYFSSFLGRPASPAELTTYVDAFLAGADETAIRQRILTSPSYLAAHPTPVLYAQSLIVDVLGRSPKPGEVARLLRGQPSAKALSRTVLRSRESSLRTVDALSSSILGHPIAPRERKALAAKLSRRSIRASTIAERFLSSSEFPD